MQQEEYSYELKVPKARLAVLIGKNGEIKKEIERETNTKITIDSKEGDILVSGKDAIKLYTTREVIKAIGRGFNPDVAKLLLKTDYVFDLVNLTTFCRNKSDIIRVKGRIIGKKGKCRRYIEELTETNISVFGKSIGVIGQVENVSIARRAIDNLLRGSPHGKVYNWLEKQRKNLKRVEVFKREVI
jgi:ribosomal RNA assembly protein